MAMPGGLKPAAPADAEVQAVADTVSPYHACSINIRKYMYMYRTI